MIAPAPSSFIDASPEEDASWHSAEAPAPTATSGSEDGEGAPGRDERHRYVHEGETAESADPFDDFEEDDFDDDFDDDFEEDWEDDLTEDEEFPDTFGGAETEDADEEEESPFSDDPDFDDE